MRRSRPSKECTGMSALDRDWFESCYKRDNNTKIVSLLDNNGININTKNKDNDNNNALMLAVFRNNQQLVELLLARNIDINSRNDLGDTALSIACDNSKGEIVKLILNHKKCNESLVNMKNSDGKSPLHIVCANRNVQLLEILLDNEFVNIDIQDKDGLTPLHILIEQDNIDLVKLLIEYGCNVNIPDNEGIAIILYIHACTH